MLNPTLDRYTQTIQQAEQTLYCDTHPSVESYLVCNEDGCNRRICLKCSVRTNVGYRCLSCHEKRRSVHFSATPFDNLLIFVLCFLVAVAVLPVYGLFFGTLGFVGFWVAVLGGPTSGSVLAQIVRKVTRRRNSRYAVRLAIGGIIGGAILGICIVSVAVDFMLWTSLPMYLFGIMAGTTVVQLLR